MRNDEPNDARITGGCTTTATPMASAPTPIDPISDLFTYHPPDPDQYERLVVVREAAKSFARILDTVVPSGADKSDAIRKLRECVMTANAAIALRGRNYRF